MGFLVDMIKQADVFGIPSPAEAVNRLAAKSAKAVKQRLSDVDNVQTEEFKANPTISQRGSRIMPDMLANAKKPIGIMDSGMAAVNRGRRVLGSALVMR